MFFSSHQLAEVEQIADHVAIVDRGQTVVAGALDDLRARYQRVQLVFDGDAPDVKLRVAGHASRAPRGPRAHCAAREREAVIDGSAGLGRRRSTCRRSR